MRAFARTLALAVPLLAALACGGRFDSLGTAGSCPVASAVTAGASCSVEGLKCSSAAGSCNGTIECTCGGGQWSCPVAEGVPCPVPECPATVTGGAACDPATQSACSPSMTVFACGQSFSTTCSCQQDGAGGTWQCGAIAVPDCADAQPPPVCPDPSTIFLGGACDTSSTLSCPSQIPIYGCGGTIDGYVSCFCDGGGWNCPEPGAPECPDVSTACPAPSSIAQGAACFSEGQQCPGNPTDCGGQTLYDAFQCTNGQWDDIATTICDLDAGGAGG